MGIVFPDDHHIEIRDAFPAGISGHYPAGNAGHPEHDGHGLGIMDAEALSGIKKEAVHMIILTESSGARPSGGVQRV